MKKWNRINNLPVIPLGENGKILTGCESQRKISKAAATEGVVLLKNSDGFLPLNKNNRVALVGKGCAGYVEYGGGSGRVSTENTVTICDGFEQKANENKISLFMPLNDLYKESVKKQYENGTWKGKAHEPSNSKELITEASKCCDTAIITISRRTCEGFDVDLSKNDNAYKLWNEEKEIIELATELFENTVVILNVPSVFDVFELQNNPKIDAILLIWNAGIEGGSAIADIVCGDAYPSGKLPDTFAKTEDYPSTSSFLESDEYVEYTEDIFVGYRYFETIPNAHKKVIYPFGYGLSYTDFAFNNVLVTKEKNNIIINLDVKNTGNFKGKEVVQIYTSSPQTDIDKPAKELRAFKKTKELLPGESEHIVIEFPIGEMASYNEGNSSFVLEKGEYTVFVGNSVRNIAFKTTLCFNYDEIIKKCNRCPEPRKLSRRLMSNGEYRMCDTSEYDKLPEHPDWHSKPTWSQEHILPDRRGVKPPQDTVMLIDVANGKKSLEEFIEQLSIEELITLVGGTPNKGVSNTYGMGDMEYFGIPSMLTADGPAGLRIEPDCEVYTTSWPCASMLASTFNTELVFEAAKAGALEVKENNFGMWLTPALNIHRNPLCGRNFEYFSEDPLLSGKMACAVVKGIQSVGVSSCVKHFCCNNKETNRYTSDSRVSERALREIYLKGFEIVVKEAKPWALMTSYNIVNGRYPSESYELITGILRNEWGFDGLICTDWCNYAEHYRELLSGNNIRMPCGSSKRLYDAYKEGLISRQDLEKSVKYLLSFLLKLE